MSNSYRKLAVGAGIVAVLLIGWWGLFGDGDSASDSRESSRTEEGGGDTGDVGGANKGSFFDRLGNWGKRYDTYDEDGNPILVKVSGRVFDIVSEESVGQVDIIFRARRSEWTATSGGGGEYELELAPGDYTVYAVGDDRYGLAERGFELSRSEGEYRYDIGVVQLAQVRGKVIDGAGYPVPGAQVSFRSRLGRGRYSSRALSRYMSVESTAESDDSGAFAFSVIPGRVEVIAEDAGAFGRAHLPDLVPGGDASVDIVIDASVAVSGVVVDPEGSPVPGATISASVVTPRPYSMDARKLVTGDDGQFVVDRLTPGDIKLEAFAEGYGASAYFSEAMVSGQSARVTLRLGPSLVIAGTVVDNTGRPLSDIEVTAFRQRSKTRGVKTVSDASGEFVFEDLGEGRYDIMANDKLVGKAWNKGIKPPADGIELQLSAPGSIRGVVKSTNGSPVTSFTARLEQVTSAVDKVTRRGTQPGTRFQSRDGAFELPVPDPGRYLVVIGATGFAPSDPVEVLVPDGGYGEAEFVLGQGGKVVGTVKSASGRAISGAQVSVFSGHEGHSVYTDSSGRFTLDNVSPGRRSIRAHHSEFIAGTVSNVEIVPEAKSEVAIELSPAEDDSDDQIEIVGIGVVLEIRADQLAIRSTVKSGPAHLARLVRGDRIVEIDGATTAGLSLSEAAERLRGSPGSRVTLSAKRENKQWDVNLDRAKVRANLPNRGALALRVVWTDDRCGA